MPAPRLLTGREEGSVRGLDDWETRGGSVLPRALDRSVAEAVEALGYECVHVGLKTDSARPRLQVLIDSIGGIGLDDCETVSKSLNRMLDEGDFSGPGAGGSYYLEVSSPGVERPLFTLAHYGRFIGREARLRLEEPVAGRRTLTGRILAVEDEVVVLVIAGDTGEEEEVRVPFGAIKGGNLVFRDPFPKERGRGARHEHRKHHEYHEGYREEL